MRALTAILALSVMGLDLVGLQLPTLPLKHRTCAITSSGIDFGVYDTVNPAPTDSTGTITYGCSQGGGAVNVVVTIDSGFGPAFNRVMTNGPDRMSYNLYLDVGRTTIWGDGSAGTDVLRDKITGSAAVVVATVYGRVFPRQNVGSGQYADGLTVTLLF